MTDSTIWTEKYRPQKFEDIKGQKKIVERIKAFVDQKNMPHILLAGPAGVGKSTIALVIAKELFKEGIPIKIVAQEINIPKTTSSNIYFSGDNILFFVFISFI